MKNNSSAYTRARLTMFLNRITVRIQIKINLLCNSIIEVTVKINTCVCLDQQISEKKTHYEPSAHAIQA